MFDDPKKNLRRLEEELLAQEEAPEDTGGELEDILQLIDQWEENDQRLRQTEDIPIRNHANGYGRSAEADPPPRNFANGYGRDTQQDAMPRNYANGYGRRQPVPGNDAVRFDRAVYADEAVDESAAVFDEGTRPKGVGGLWILFLLELIGILAVIWWWVRWLV